VGRARGSERYARHIQRHRQRCQNESLGPQLLSCHHQSSFERYASRSSMWGGSLKIREARIARHVIPACPLPSATTRPWHPKRNQTSKFSKDRTVRVSSQSHHPPYMFFLSKAENKVLDYIKRVRRYQSNARSSPSSPVLDKPSIWRRRHLCQPERCRPKNSHAEGTPCAGRKGRGHAENIRYSFLSRVSRYSLIYICMRIYD
jgi:hypothetical protein